MRGGKREGAGRKGLGQSKSYWLPIAIEEQVIKLLSDYKESLTQKPEENPKIDLHRKSKEPMQPMFPILNKDQIHRFRQWLIDRQFVKGVTEARKITDNPRLCKKTFLKYIHTTDERHNDTISDICELYSVD